MSARKKRGTSCLGFILLIAILAAAWFLVSKSGLFGSAPGEQKSIGRMNTGIS